MSRKATRIGTACSTTTPNRGFYPKAKWNQSHGEAIQRNGEQRGVSAKNFTPKSVPTAPVFYPPNARCHCNCTQIARLGAFLYRPNHDKISRNSGLDTENRNPCSSRFKEWNWVVQASLSMRSEGGTVKEKQ